MRSAVVVGAGIGGLATAGALARTGWQVTLLDRAERIRAGRAGLLLWPNGVRALRSLGLDAGLDAIATPVERAALARPDGRPLRRTAPEAAHGVPLAVHSEDLHDALVAGLGDKLDIRTGAAVSAVRTPGADRPAVADGRTTWEADLVVAADGVHSVVRQRLGQGGREVSGGYAAWRAVIPWFRAPRLAEGTAPAGETLGAGQRFLYASLGERRSAGTSSRGGIYWVATAPGAARPEPPDMQLTLLKRWFAGWHPPIGDLLDATYPEDLVQETVTELRPVPERFVAPSGPGGYALLGSAAHAFADHLGQAASVALEDAATLVALVAAAPPGTRLVSALHGYQRGRHPRAVRLARQARRLGIVLQAGGRRGLAVDALAPRLLASAAAAANDWQPPAAPPLP